MKQIVAAISLALLAGCANVPDNIKNAFAGGGSTAQPDTAGWDSPVRHDATREYPYNPSNGD